MEISVCIIAKNEQENLPNILACAKQFADEIVVVDTGSCDNTKKIAKNFGAKVFDFVWQNNFSDARNFSFSKASKAYIMWLDADDFITQENIQKIKELKTKNINADVFMFKYAVGFDKNNNPTFQFNRERILKKEKNFVWKGFLHEAIEIFGTIEYCDITINHVGKKNKDPMRNLKIYRHQKKMGTKFNAREQYYYAKELFYNGFYKKAITELKKFLAFDQKFLPNELDAILTISKCLQQMNDDKNALLFLQKNFAFYEPNAEICCEIAKLFTKFNQFNNALFFYKCALNCTPNLKRGDFVMPQFYGIIPLLNLTCLCFKTGDIDAAKHYHNLCKHLDPTDPAVEYNEKFFNSLNQN